MLPTFTTSCGPVLDRPSGWFSRLSGALALTLALTACAGRGGHDRFGDVTFPVLQLSQSEFPASRTCRFAPRAAESCADPLYATFTLSYVIGDVVTWADRAAIRISFANKYNGAYRTESIYTKAFAWPLPQTLDPVRPNYVSARLVGTDPRVAHELVFDAEERLTLLLGAEGTTPVPVLAKGSIVEITFGDTSGGSPGQITPPIAYDVDLVVEHDADNDGRFTLVEAEMPILSVVGTQVDTFVVVARSTPRDNRVQVIVQAMEGLDAPTTNMYTVPGYTGTISFSCSDPKAKLPADYAFLPDDRGVRKFLIRLESAGVHTIEVTDLATGKTGRSNPVILGALPRQGDDNPAERLAGMNLYWGSLHQHTNIGGHGTQTPEFAYGYARNVSGLDFLALSEHCGTPHFDWDWVKELADAFYAPDDFVTFAAYEWSNRHFGHRHIVYRDASQGACYCPSKGPTVVRSTELGDLFEKLKSEDVLVIPHHTGWKYSLLYPTPEDDVTLGSGAYPNQRLFEVYSHHGSSEKYDNAPYVIHGDAIRQWGPKKGIYFQDAIAQGYKFGVTADGDDHMGQPGGHVSLESHDGVETLYSRNGLTAVYADELTRDGIWSGLRARRTYGTTGARIILEFAIGGTVMGEEATLYSYPDIYVSVIGQNTIRSVTIIKDGYNTFHKTNPGTTSCSIRVQDRNIEKGREHSYYVRVVQDDLHYAWSSPIWVRVEPVPE